VATGEPTLRPQPAACCQAKAGTLSRRRGVEVFASFSKKKRFFLLLSEKQNQKTFIPKAARIRAIDERLIAL
jgi:hypothetical protein